MEFELGEVKPSQLTFIAEIIGECKDSDFVRALLTPLLSHGSRIVREGAIYGLEQHTNEELRAKFALIAASDESEGVRRAAQEAIERFYD